MENELYHYGILGMKWGVRRSRAQLDRAAGRKSRTDDWSEDAKTVSSLRKKSASQLSNAELKKVNERVRLEQEYSKLNPSKIKKGMAIAAGVAATLTTINNLYTSSDNLVKNGKKLVDKLGKK